MLALDILSADAHEEWRATPQGWSRGRSLVSPYDHEALEHVALCRDGDLLVVVRERRRGFPPLTSPGRGDLPHTDLPHTDLPHTDAPEWHRVLDETLAWPLQFLVVVVTPRDVTVTSGRWGTAPLYLTGDRSGLHGHWDPALLYGRLPEGPVLDPVLALHFLTTLDVPYSRRTLLRDLSRVTQGSTARWDVEDGRVCVTYPGWEEPPAPRRLAPEADVLGGLWDCLTAAVARWAPVARPAAELSSGLDSALISAAAGATCDHPPLRTYGLELPGPPGERQRARRTHLAARLGTLDTPVPVEGLEPFAPGGTRTGGSAVVPWEGTYHEAFDAMAARAAADGARVVFSGHGGDELCYDRSPRSRHRRRHPDDPLPEFLTSTARDLLRDTDVVAELAPPGVATESTVHVATLSSPRYLRRGLWPLYPFAAPELVTLCARLPAAWRSDRRWERLLLTQRGVGTRVTDAGETDSFAPVMARGLRRAGPRLLLPLWRDSRLADLGWVDPGRLVDRFTRWTRGGSEDLDISYYTAGVLELCLRSRAAPGADLAVLDAAGPAGALPPQRSPDTVPRASATLPPQRSPDTVPRASATLPPQRSPETSSRAQPAR